MHYPRNAVAWEIGKIELNIKSSGENNKHDLRRKHSSPSYTAREVFGGCER